MKDKPERKKNWSSPSKSQVIQKAEKRVMQKTCMVSHPLLCLRNKFIAQSAAAMQLDEGGVNTYIHLGSYLFRNTEKMCMKEKEKKRNGLQQQPHVRVAPRYYLMLQQQQQCAGVRLFLIYIPKDRISPGWWVIDLWISPKWQADLLPPFLPCKSRLFDSITYINLGDSATNPIGHHAPYRHIYHPISYCFTCYYHIFLLFVLPTVTYICEVDSWLIMLAIHTHTALLTVAIYFK